MQPVPEEEFAEEVLHGFSLFDVSHCFYIIYTDYCSLQSRGAEVTDFKL